MKKPDFLHIDTNSWKLKFDWNILGEGLSKMSVATLGSQDSKTGCISVRNERKKLIYGVLIQIQES